MNPCNNNCPPCWKEKPSGFRIYPMPPHIYFIPCLTLTGPAFHLMKDGELVLGPFMGKPACVRIPVGKGVCGTAVKEERPQLVKNVLEFAGHIACDADSRSEIVIPLSVNGKIIGVLDIDSPKEARFDEEDLAQLEKYAEIIIQKTDWSPLLAN
jgi:L-methionine (R)-S-oxide reductase